MTDSSSDSTIVGDPSRPPRPAKKDFVSSRRNPEQFKAKARSIVGKTGGGSSFDIQKRAVELAVANYNKHHDPEKTPALSTSHAYVAEFTMLGKDWCALVRSNVARGMLFYVSYNSTTRVTTLEVYRKINVEEIGD